MVKARIAPHGNNDDLKDDLKKSSATCSPFGVRIALSIAMLKKWNVAKIDITAVFL